MTPFALLCQACGLSHREAVDFLKVRPDTVKSWSAGRNPTPLAVIDELVALADKIDEAANEAVDQMDLIARRHGPAEAVELGLATTDREARALGLPCVGAHRMTIALTLARASAQGHIVTVVRRGSTPATKAAKRIHNR